jgi:hypothetical protein
MKNRWKYFLWAVVSVILVGNLLSAFIGTMAEGPTVLYRFETQHGEFEFVVDPAGGLDATVMEQEFQNFLRRYPKTEDRELYRTFERKPWQFWNWYHYLTSELYEYPFKERNTSE